MELKSQEASATTSITPDDQQQSMQTTSLPAAIEETAQDISMTEPSQSDTPSESLFLQGQRETGVDTQAEHEQIDPIARVQSVESGEIIESEDKPIIENDEIVESVVTEPESAQPESIPIDMDVDVPHADGNQSPNETSTTGPPPQPAKEPTPTKFSNDSELIDPPNTGKFT